MNFSQALYEKHKLELLSDRFIQRGKGELKTDDLMFSLSIDFSISPYPLDTTTPRDEATKDFIQIVDTVFKQYDLNPFYGDNADVSSLNDKLNNKGNVTADDETVYFDYRGGFFLADYDEESNLVSKAILLAQIEYTAVNEWVNISITVDSESDFVISLLKGKLQEEFLKAQFEEKYPNVSFYCSL